VVTPPILSLASMPLSVRMRGENSSAVTHGPGQHLMDQHISRLDTDTDDSGQQPNHGRGGRSQAAALIFAPDRGSQVRIRLTAGGRRIRTLGPPSRARCVFKTVLTDPRLFPRERNPGRGTKGPHPACSAEESVSPVPSMATGAKAGADVAIDIAECGESRSDGQLPGLNPGQRT
jgi:hypothetical protein